VGRLTYKAVVTVGVEDGLDPGAFRLLADVAPLAVLMYRGRECVYANRSAELITGRSASDLLGRPFIDLVHPDDRELVLANEEAVARGERREAQADLRILHADGAVRWVDGRSKIVEYQERRGGVVFLQDITARVQAERALRESEQRLRAFFVHSSAGLCILDRELRYHMVNETLARLNGKPAEAHVGQPLARMAPTIAPMIRPHLERVLQGGEPVLDHEISPEMTGMRGHYHCSYFPVVTATGQITGAGVIVLDVTALREAEDHERQLEVEMAKLHRLESLEQMAGGIAHDFNNLLVGILGNASLALDRPSTDTVSRECLLDIEEAANRAAELAGQMLAFAGQGTHLPRALDLNRLINELEGRLRAAVPGVVALTVVLAPDPCPVDGDEAQLRQALWNLVRNAVEALDHRGGEIIVRTTTVEADRQLLSATYIDDRLPPGRYVCVEVTDNGPGIAPETLHRIFDPFFSTKFTGRGLGLPAVLGIVRRHRGAIQIKGRPRGGTAFRIFLPVAGAIAAQSTAPPPGRAVLLVDDEPLVVKVARRMLERMGYSVLTACDGATALELFRSRGDEIGCVLLDLSMPGMDGPQTLRELRKIDQAVPVLLSSGFSATTLAERVVGLEFNGFVQKPYRLSLLRAKLDEALGNG